MVKGRPAKAAPSNPLVQKGWDTESLSGFMDHILLQIKGRLRANDECHCLGFPTVASSPPKQDGTHGSRLFRKEPNKSGFRSPLPSRSLYGRRAELAVRYGTS